MAQHPKLEENDFAVLRKIFAHLYPYGQSGSPVDFSSRDTSFTIVKSGRLSFVFTAENGGEKVFLKIAKPGFVTDNIPASVVATEELRINSSVPTIQTYAGAGGTLSQVVPKELEGVDQEILKLFAGQRVTLTRGVEIDAIPEDLKSMGAAMPTLMRELGRMGAKITRGLKSLIGNDEFTAAGTADPFGFRALRQMFVDDFRISQEDTHLSSSEVKVKVQAKIDSMISNLDPKDPAAAGFAQGLARGDLIEILDMFNAIEARVSVSLDSYPAPNVVIHNEVKPANVGAQLVTSNNTWVVTQFYDFDQVALGTLVNGDRTPAEKDLGRSISFLSFDPKTGEFFPDNAKQLIAGFLERQPVKLTDAQIERLEDYIKLGVLTSYPVRSSYLAEELQGRPTDIKLGRLDPSIHLVQLKQFDDWLGKNDFKAIVRELERDEKIERHQRITKIEDEFLATNAYEVLGSIEGAVQVFSYAIDAAHSLAEGNSWAQSMFDTSVKTLMDKIPSEQKRSVGNVVKNTFDDIKSVATPDRPYT